MVNCIHGRSAIREGMYKYQKSVLGLRCEQDRDFYFYYLEKKVKSYMELKREGAAPAQPFADISKEDFKCDTVGLRKETLPVA